mgnify:CR=1 FL=1
MLIAVTAYQIAYRGVGAAAANDCSQNKTQQIVFVLHNILYICRVIYKSWQTYKKITERAPSSPANLPVCFRACLSLLVAWCPSYFNCGTSGSKLSPHLHSPCQYHVCVLPQWSTLLGISVLLYILSIFLFSHYQLSLITPRLFVPKNPEKHLCQREFSAGATKNPLPHNGKSALP